MSLILQEDGSSHITLEDSSGSLLLETVSAGNFILQEDGSSHITLEDSSGSLLLEGTGPSISADINVQRPYGSLWIHPY